jgi:hypothetical protein
VDVSGASMDRLDSSAAVILHFGHKPRRGGNVVEARLLAGLILAQGWWQTLAAKWPLNSHRSGR